MRLQQFIQESACFNLVESSRSVQVVVAPNSLDLAVDVVILKKVWDSLLAILMRFINFPDRIFNSCICFKFRVFSLDRCWCGFTRFMWTFVEMVVWERGTVRLHVQVIVRQGWTHLSNRLLPVVLVKQHLLSLIVRDTHVSTWLILSLCLTAIRACWHDQSWGIILGWLLGSLDLLWGNRRSNCKFVVVELLARLLNFFLLLSWQVVLRHHPWSECGCLLLIRCLTIALNFFRVELHLRLHKSWHRC